MNTTHRFGHFRSTDFHETPREYVNHCPRESFRTEILKFPLRGSLFPQKLTDFGTPFRYLRSTFGVSNSKTARRRRTLTKERYILDMSSIGWRQSDRPKTYPLRCSLRKRRASPILPIVPAAWGAYLTLVLLLHLLHGPNPFRLPQVYAKMFFTIITIAA